MAILFSLLIHITFCCNTKNWYVKHAILLTVFVKFMKTTNPVDSWLCLVIWSMFQKFALPIKFHYSMSLLVHAVLPAFYHILKIFKFHQHMDKSDTSQEASLPFIDWFLKPCRTPQSSLFSSTISKFIDSFCCHSSILCSVSHGWIYLLLVLVLLTSSLTSLHTFWKTIKINGPHICWLSTPGGTLFSISCF